MSEDGHLVVARLVLTGQEGASEGRHHAQDSEEGRAHLGAFEADGSPAAGQGDAAAVEGGQRLERLRRRLHVQEVLRRVDAGVTSLPDLRHHHQPIRLLEGQRPEQDGVHHAEYRAVGADAEGEGRDGDEREAGRLPEPTERIDEVLPQGVHAPSQSQRRASERPIRSR